MAGAMASPLVRKDSNSMLIFPRSVPLLLPLLPLLLLLLLLQCSATASSIDRNLHRRIQVDLMATWEATSLAHETAEWLGDAAVDGPRAFYTFAEAMMPGKDGSTACWKRLNTAMGDLVDGQLLQVGRVALASRQYSPRLEAFRQLSTASDPGTCCWAVLNGDRVITDPKVSRSS